MSDTKINKKILLIGIGNDGRSDDALGWLFADKCAEQYPFDVLHRYQLQIEDAETISGYDLVFFADASIEESNQSYNFQKSIAATTLSYSTHEISPSTLLGLCQSLYDKSPEAYTIAIRGYHWELNFGLSGIALLNLEAARRAFQRFIYQNELLEEMNGVNI